MKIVLFGKNGQLGRAINKILSNDFEVYSYNKEELNLLNFAKIEKTIRKVNPKIIINAAAYTNVDLAEQEQELALSINAESLNIIANVAKDCNARLIHFSTDYVFDGRSDRAYLEDDPTNPINYYGFTKLVGEKNILHSGCSYFIFRSSWIVSNVGKNFVKTIIKIALKNKKLDVVSDQIGVPTSTELISRITKEFIIKNEYKDDGIYHLTPNGSTSWYELSKYIVNYLEKKNYSLKLNSKNIVPVLSKDFDSKAARPLNSLLSNRKLSKEIDQKIESWDVGIDNILDKISL